MDKLEAGVQAAYTAAGTRAELAKRINAAKGKPITQQGVGKWKRIPAERVPIVAKVTGIPRSVLRPDLYSDS